MCKKKSSAEIDELIAQWATYPGWDLEDTEGFEEYRPALKAVREAYEVMWGRMNQEKLIEKADRIGMPGNAVFAQYVLGLEEKVMGLTNRMDEMLNRMATLESKVKHA